MLGSYRSDVEGAHGSSAEHEPAPEPDITETLITEVLKSEIPPTEAISDNHIGIMATLGICGQVKGEDSRIYGEFSRGHQSEELHGAHKVERLGIMLKKGFVHGLSVGAHK